MGYWSKDHQRFYVAGCTFFALMGLYALLSLVLMVAEATEQILGGMEPGEFVVEADSADTGGYLLFRTKALDPDSVYFFPRHERWDAYIMGGNATTWATCTGMTGWVPTRSTETPGYIALEHRGLERYGVVFVYFDTSWAWDGSYDYIIKQQ